MQRKRNSLVGARERPAQRRRFAIPTPSLQFKTTALVVALTLLLSGGVTWYFVRVNAKMAVQQQVEQVQELARIVARSAARPLSANDVASLSELAQFTSDGTPLVYVIFQDRERRELAGAYHGDARRAAVLRARIGSQPIALGIPTLHRTSGSNPAFMDILYPIEEATADADGTNGLIGYVRTGMLVDAWHRSIAQAVDLAIGVGIVVVVFAIPLGFMLVRRVVAPLDDVVAAMDRFSTGDLNVRSPIRRDDEIGRLAAAFNRMADEHQRTHGRITQLNSELEDRVARRTLQLRELASRDSLTGLYNRRHFNELLQNRLAEAMRYNTELSCVMIDLDNFKTVNDLYGHQVGDELLTIAAAAVKHELRASDVAARFGGDELILLLPQTDGEQAHVLAERITTRFKRECRARRPDVPIGMSMGAATSRALRVLDATALIRAADDALYKAKAAGKDCIVIGDRHAVVQA